MRHSSRMDLKWSDENVDVLYDVQNKDLFSYASEEAREKLHARFGGRCASMSETGLSGVGWVKKSPALIKLGSYRTDCSLPTMAATFPSGEEVDQERPWAKTILVPVDLNTGEIDHDYPVMVCKAGMWDVAIRGESIIHALTMANKDSLWLLAREFVFETVPRPEGEVETHTIRVGVETEADEGYPRGGTDPRGPELFRSRWPGMGRAIKAANFEDLKFEWPTPGEWACREKALDFYSHLGLFPLEGRLYKVAQGICWGSWPLAEMNTAEALGAIAPTNVVFLWVKAEDGLAYIQSPEDDLYGEDFFRARGLFIIKGKPYDYEICLRPEEAYESMAGDQEVISQLRKGAQERADDLLAQAQKRADRQTELAALAAKC